LDLVTPDQILGQIEKPGRKRCIGIQSIRTWLGFEISFVKHFYFWISPLGGQNHDFFLYRPRTSPGPKNLIFFTYIFYYEISVHANWKIMGETIDCDTLHSYLAYFSICMNRKKYIPVTSPKKPPFWPVFIREKPKKSKKNGPRLEPFFENLISHQKKSIF
jgi:hypothetical protein